uniref:UPF3 domain-containing protein n=1 Tax=Naja naja TaxID=35670 RepID=A0A8C6XJF8_NAJNA
MIILNSFQTTLGKQEQKKGEGWLCCTQRWHVMSVFQFLHPSVLCIFIITTQQRFLTHCHFLSFCSLYPHMFSRAYINFKNQEDIVLFRDRFDGYVFIDHKGLEYPAIVEFAPFQKAAKKKSKKKDAKAGTIDDG